MHHTEPLPRLFGLLAATASALMLFAAGEPLGWGPLAWVALVPLLLAILRVEHARWAFLYGLVFGLVYFGVELWWISLFGWIAWAPLVAFLSLYIAVGTLVAGWVRRRSLAPVLVAGAWAGAELLRDRWPYGGYPWGSVGTTQGNVWGVRWLAGVVGTYGLSFLAVFVAAIVAHRLVAGRISGASVLVVGVVLAGFVWADVAATPEPESGTLDLVVVQGNVPRPVQPGQRDRIFESHLSITKDLIASEAPDTQLGRVVVWPEDSMGIGVSEDAIDQIQDLAARTATPFLIGRSTLEGPEQDFVNRVEHIDTTGRTVARYQKRHPVPFGEYVPVSFFRRFVSTLEAEIPSDQEPGTVATVFDVDTARVATPICFESVFPRDFLDFAREGAEVYVLSTNNASFERSYASDQHLAHTRMRALETRQWVVQAALSGISASIAPDGTISNRTDLFEATGFETTVGLRKANSLYARTGDLFPSLFAGLSALATLWGMVRRRRRTT